MAATKGSNTLDTIDLKVTREEYDQIVYSLSVAAGYAAQDAGRSTRFGPRPSNEQRYFNQLVALQSKVMAWGDFIARANTANESPPATLEETRAASAAH